MKHTIDIEHWERKEVFTFFQDFADSSVSVTTEVECGPTFTLCKEKSSSFSLYCMYAVLKAANEIPEMRTRIEEGGRQVCQYDRIGVVTPIKVNEKGKFVEAYIDYEEDFSTFYKRGYEKIHSLDENSDPYEFVKSHPSYYGVMNISITPDLYFTAVRHTQHYAYGDIFPLLNIGKAVQREGRWVIPIAITVNHALTDGHHLALFFKKIEAWLTRPQQLS